MEQIIWERGSWPAEGLNAQCPKFHCPPGRTDCCCRRLLFSQLDFVNQKSQLQELIESRGHICDFYPKYHCELNFIKQYWGTAKLRFRSMMRAATLEKMEKQVISSLDNVPLLQIRRWFLFMFSHRVLSLMCSFSRYANRAAHFISGYGQGLSSAQAIWANRKYYGHCTLSLDLLEEVRKSIM